MGWLGFGYLAWLVWQQTSSSLNPDCFNIPYPWTRDLPGNVLWWWQKWERGWAETHDTTKELGFGTVPLPPHSHGWNPVPWQSPTTAKVGEGYSASGGRNSKSHGRKCIQGRTENWEGECNWSQASLEIFIDSVSHPGMVRHYTSKFSIVETSLHAWNKPCLSWSIITVTIRMAGFYFLILFLWWTGFH